MRLSLVDAKFFVDNSSFEDKNEYTSDKRFDTELSPYNVLGFKVSIFPFTLERVL